MENTLEIQVTRKDLKQSYRSPISCPIATAIKRSFPEYPVYVSSQDLVIGHTLYSLRPEDNRKAQMRGSGKLLGKTLFSSVTIEVLAKNTAKIEAANKNLPDLLTFDGNGDRN